MKQKMSGYPGFVYFIHSPAMKRMKVGKTSGPVRQRLNVMQTGSADLLQIALMLRVEDMFLESHLHGILRKRHCHLEWFRWEEFPAELKKTLRGWESKVVPVAEMGVRHPLGEEICAAIWGNQPIEWESVSDGRGDGPSGLRRDEYCRHEQLRGEIAAMAIGDSRMCGDKNQRTIVYRIAIALGYVVTLRQDKPGGSGPWLLERLG